MQPIYYSGPLAGAQQQSELENYLISIFDEYLDMLVNDGTVTVKIGAKIPGALASTVSLTRIALSGEDSYDILSDTGDVLASGLIVSGLTSAAMFAMIGGITVTGSAAIGGDLRKLGLARGRRS